MSTLISPHFQPLQGTPCKLVSLQEVIDYILTHRLRLTRFAQKLSGNRDEAEDVVQEIILRLHTLPPNRLPERGAMKAFVGSMIKNLTTDRQRKGKYIAGNLQDPVFAPWEQAAQCNVPLEVEQRLLLEQIHQVIRWLPSEQREAVLIWSMDDDITNVQAAHRLGITPKAFRIRKHQGLNAIRERLHVSKDHA
jgi:RNA polymerase sigma-70 factor (ECF subfamily)